MSDTDSRQDIYVTWIKQGFSLTIFFYIHDSLTRNETTVAKKQDDHCVLQITPECCITQCSIHQNIDVFDTCNCFQFSWDQPSYKV